MNASRLTGAQAFAQGFGIDPTAAERGRTDAKAGLIRRCPEGLDPLSYAIGYLRGQTGRCTPREEQKPDDPA